MINIQRVHSEFPCSSMFQTQLPAVSHLSGLLQKLNCPALGWSTYTLSNINNVRLTWTLEHELSCHCSWIRSLACMHISYSTSQIAVNTSQSMQCNLLQKLYGLGLCIHEVAWSLHWSVKPKQTCNLRGFQEALGCDSFESRLLSLQQGVDCPISCGIEEHNM